VLEARGRSNRPPGPKLLAFVPRPDVCIPGYIHPVTDSSRPLPPPWFQILLALANRDLHGLGIMNDVLAQTGGQMRLWPAVLYRNLRRLERAGLGKEDETRST